jgi:hypothetical protein
MWRSANRRQPSGGAWGERVVRRLEDRLGPIAGTAFELHAGAMYRRATESGIAEHGEIVIAPLAHLGQGEQLVWYTAGEPRPRGGDR